MTRYLFILATVTPLTTSNAQEHKNNLSGNWSTTCDNGTILKIISMNESFLEVNKNQIYIKTKAEKNKDSINLVLVDPEDLGPGGMRLKWNSFSRKLPIAVVKNISDRTIHFEWIGFYDESSSSRTWTNEPGFFTLGDNTFQKCSDIKP
jgi:hypothetical protein